MDQTVTHEKWAGVLLMAIISALGRLRQENYLEFKASLGYTVSFIRATPWGNSAVILWLSKLYVPRSLCTCCHSYLEWFGAVLLLVKSTRVNCIHWKPDCDSPQMSLYSFILGISHFPWLFLEKPRPELSGMSSFFQMPSLNPCTEACIEISLLIPNSASKKESRNT